MPGIFDMFSADSDSLVLTMLIFLAAATLAFSVMVAVRVRNSVKRRTTASSTRMRARQNARCVIQAARPRKAFSTTPTSTIQAAISKVRGCLRKRLLQAGIFEASAVAKFFIIRAVLALGIAAAIFFLIPMVRPIGSNSTFWLLVIAGGVFGYVGPSMYIDKRIKKRRQEHREGFPDFMDLLVVCADSGLPIEAALERVGREFGDTYPSLAANVHMTNLEIRAGRTLS